MKNLFKKGHKSFNIKDESDNRYGKLIVLSRATNDKFNNAKWNCKCDCGKKKQINGASLRLGRTKSCGCIGGGVKRSGNTALLRYYNSYVFGAKHRNIIFELDIRDFIDITSSPCFFCDELPNNKHYAYHRTRYSKGKQSDEAYAGNGIDRLNNTKGYIRTNVVACCSICNKMKSDLPIKIFKNKINQIYNNFVI